LHNPSEHWQQLKPVFLPLAVGQIEQLPWVQNGPVGCRNKKVHKKQHTHKATYTYVPSDECLCQWDLNEQIEKMVRMLLYNSENCSRKFHAWVHFVPSQ